MPGGGFPSTRHSLLAGVRSEAEPVRRDALERLAEAYWKPAYKYIRLRWRRSAEDAEDLTQDFFSQLLARGLVARYDAARASFRTYIRTCIDSHVMDAAQTQSALKRGGGARILSLDAGAAEQELAAGAIPAGLSPEEIFYREWQREIFALAVADLRALCSETGRQTQFAIFEQYDLSAGERSSYAGLARRFSIPETSVTNALAWARRELRRLALARLAGLTSDDSEFRAEARSLFQP